MQTLHDEQVNI